MWTIDTYPKLVANGKQDGLSYIFNLNLNFNISNDNVIEKYDPEKIKSVVVAAGLSEKKADLLCDKVNEWAVGLKRKVVTSIEIKDKVVEEIKKLDDYAAKKYIWYEKYKDKIRKITNQ